MRLRSCLLKSLLYKVTLCDQSNTPNNYYLRTTTYDQVVFLRYDNKSKTHTSVYRVDNLNILYVVIIIMLYNNYHKEENHKLIRVKFTITFINTSHHFTIITITGWMIITIILHSIILLPR